MHQARSEDGVEFDGAIALGGEDKCVREEVVESPPVATDDDDPRRSEAECDIERQFQVGGVLRDGMAMHRGAALLEFTKHRRIERVEVADRDIDDQTQCERMCGAGISGDHDPVRMRRGELCRHQFGIGRVAARDHDGGARRHGALVKVS